MRYLSGTISHGLLSSPSLSDQKLSFRAYSGFNWASDPDDRRPTSSTCIFFGPNLISWSSKKKLLVARSSAEAEYRTLAHTTCKLLWIESLLTERGVSFRTLTLLCDNMSVVLMSHKSVLHARKKHMELDMHFVRELPPKSC